jgi:hypothetical protein
VDIDSRDLEALLHRLDEEERHVSSQRAKLHQRIGFYPDDAALAAKERELSDRRRALHARIDEVRGQLGLEPWRPGEPRVETKKIGSAGFDVDFSTF